MTNCKKTIVFLATAAALVLINQTAKADAPMEFDLGEFASGAQGDEAHTTATTGEGPQGVGADVTSNATGKQIEVTQRSQYGLLTDPGIYDSFPSGQWSFGFTGGGATTYSADGGLLPQTATSSVDLSITNGW